MDLLNAWDWVPIIVNTLAFAVVSYIFLDWWYNDRREEK